MSRYDQPSAPETPQEHAGRIFRDFSTITPEYRLEYHAGRYTDDAVWDEYVAHKAAQRGGVAAETRRKRYGIARERLAEVCAERGRHYAVARPADVEAFFESEAHLSDHVFRDRRFMPVYGFFEYLRYHTDHPHEYNPVLLAAFDADSHARRGWNLRQQRNQDTN